MAKRKGGKWAAVLSTLKAAPPEDMKYQAIVDLMKESITTEAEANADGRRVGASYYADLYVEQRKVIDAIKEQLSNEQVRLTALTQLVVANYEAEGISRVILESGESVGVQGEPQAKVVDRVALRQWAIDNGFEEMLALPWPTVNSMLKAALEAGQALPAGVEAVPIYTPVYRKATGEGAFIDLPSPESLV